MVKLLRKFIINKISDEKKNVIYAYLVRIPLLQLVLKCYIKKTSPFCMISFPKCGRTWLRVMIGKVLQLHFKTSESDILTLPSSRELSDYPGLVFIHDDDVHWKKPEELI